MTDTTDTNNTTAGEASDGHNVIAVAFEDDQNAYTALTSLKELDSQHRVVVKEASVIFRGEDGQVVVKDSVETSSLPATAGGGLIGLLVGILGGPLGVLLGGSYGLFVGSLVDLSDIDEVDSSLGRISSSVKLGRTALLAVVDEPDNEIVDASMAAHGGTVARRPVAEVQAEIAAAEEAERTAKWEARKELIRGREQRDKAAVDAKLEELKAKLHRGERTGAAVAGDAG